MEPAGILEVGVAHLVSNLLLEPEVLNWSAQLAVPSGSKVVRGVESRTRSGGGASSLR